jgi:hypothetical protein
MQLDLLPPLVHLQTTFRTIPLRHHSLRIEATLKSMAEFGLGFVVYSETTSVYLSADVLILLAWGKEGVKMERKQKFG